ncbi:hypothetical protein DVH24_041416 [Malus domestica]|uniref:Uncharacterized protein n=1 Tax=Malus domestica TaxID=3750 RepID=A0A498IBE0_MALDO|nr:hypothetical protein DVH24_041416 [Malus domestica]
MHVCDKLLRFQTNRCPICRQPIKRRLTIKVNNGPDESVISGCVLQGIVWYANETRWNIKRAKMPSDRNKKEEEGEGDVIILCSTDVEQVVPSRAGQTGTGTADGQTSVPRQLPSLDSAKIDVDDQSVEPVEELEKKSEEFQKILKVSNEERDWVQRMQVVDRAAAAIAAARAILEDKNKELRTEAGDRGGSGGGSGGGGDGTIGARQEGKDLDIVFDF